MMEVIDADGGAMIACALALDADVGASAPAPWLLLASVEDILRGGCGGRCAARVERE
jgi:hypothetical protein